MCRGVPGHHRPYGRLPVHAASYDPGSRKALGVLKSSAIYSTGRCTTLDPPCQLLVILHSPTVSHMPPTVSLSRSRMPPWHFLARSFHPPTQTRALPSFRPSFPRRSSRAWWRRQDQSRGCPSGSAYARCTGRRTSGGPRRSTRRLRCSRLSGSFAMVDTRSTLRGTTGTEGGRLYPPPVDQCSISKQTPNLFVGGLPFVTPPSLAHRPSPTVLPPSLTLAPLP